MTRCKKEWLKPPLLTRQYVFAKAKAKALKPKTSALKPKTSEPMVKSSALVFVCVCLFASELKPKTPLLKRKISKLKLKISELKPKTSELKPKVFELMPVEISISKYFRNLFCNYKSI